MPINTFSKAMPLMALHIILACVTQMIQGNTPGIVKLSSLRNYATPWILPKFKYVRLIFVAMVVFHSFYIKTIPSYLVWYIGSVAWIHIFTSCKFGKASRLSMFLSMYAILITAKFHAPFTTIVWSVYILYISSWYHYCLPK